MCFRSKELEEFAADQKQAQAQNQINAESGKDAEVEFSQAAPETYDNNLLDLSVRLNRKLSGVLTSYIG